MCSVKLHAERLPVPYVLPTRTLYGMVLLCFGLMVKYATEDLQLQFVMKKVEA